MSEEGSLSERILEWVEKDRFSLTTAIIYVFIIAALRSLLDSYVIGNKMYNTYQLAHYVLLAYPEFLLGALVIYALTKAPIRKIWNVILLGFWILLVPPIIDYYILGESGRELGIQYGYLSMDQMLPMLMNLWNPLYRPEEIGSTGQAFMFLFMIVGSGAYIALRTGLPSHFRSLFRQGKRYFEFFTSLVRTLLVYIGMLLIFWLIAAFHLALRVGVESVIVLNTFHFRIDRKYYEFFYNYGYGADEVLPPLGLPRMGLLETLAHNQNNLLFGFFFLIVCVILTLISLYLCYKKPLMIMLKNVRPLDTSLMILASFMGIASVHLIDRDFSKGLAIDPLYILHSQYVLFCLVAIFLLIQFTLLLDDIFAYGRDEKRGDPLSKGLIPKYHYKQLAAAYALTALFISFVLGRWTLFLSIVWILLSFGFSMNRTKNNFVDLTKGGILGSLAFLYGYNTPGSWIAFIAEHFQGEWIHATNETIIRTPHFTAQTFGLLLWILLGLSLLSLFGRSGGYINTDILDKTSWERNKGFVQPAVLFLIFLLPLIFTVSPLGMIIIVSIALGTYVWYRLIDNGVVIKMGFVLLLFILSFLLM